MVSSCSWSRTEAWDRIRFNSGIGELTNIWMTGPEMEIDENYFFGKIFFVKSIQTFCCIWLLMTPNRNLRSHPFQFRYWWIGYHLNDWTGTGSCGRCSCWWRTDWSYGQSGRLGDFIYGISGIITAPSSTLHDFGD